MRKLKQYIRDLWAPQESEYDCFCRERREQPKRRVLNEAAHKLKNY